MKKNTITLLSSIALLTCSTTCFAANDSTVATNHIDVVTCELLPYFRLDSGWAMFENVKGTRVQNNNSKLTSQANPIVGAGVGLGLNFGDKFRSDFTWSRHINLVFHADNANYNIKRKPVIDAYFFNLYYELGNLITVFSPYIGAGVGVAVVKDKLSVLTITNDITSVSENIARKNNFAYKFIIGSAFDLNERVKFDLSYSFNDYGKTKSRLDASKNQIGKTHYKAHVISAGLRFGM